MSIKGMNSVIYNHITGPKIIVGIDLYEYLENWDRGASEYGKKVDIFFNFKKRRIKVAEYVNGQYINCMKNMFRTDKMVKKWVHCAENGADIYNWKIGLEVNHSVIGGNGFAGVTDYDIQERRGHALAYLNKRFGITRLSEVIYFDAYGER